MAMINDLRLRWLYFLYWSWCFTGVLSQSPCASDTGSFSFGSASVYLLQYGECSFATPLCNYTQYCTDPDADNWRHNKDYAECPGKNGRLDAFSVLASPLLDIKHVTCLQFEFTQVLPGRLSVYLASRTSSTLVKPESDFDATDFQADMAEIQNDTGRVLFRARHPDLNREVKIRNVQLLTGSCTMPACSFGDEMAECLSGTCGWSFQGWSITKSLRVSPDIPDIITTTSSLATRAAKLTTTLVQAKGSETDCLEFAYILCGLEARLLVSIQPLGEGLIPQWNLSSDPNITDCSKSWQFAQVPVSSSSALTILTEGLRTSICNDAGSRPCMAKVSPHIQVRVGTGHLSPCWEKGTTAVTAGVVAGVVLVITCLVAVGVVWRRRQIPQTQNLGSKGVVAVGNGRTEGTTAVNSTTTQRTGSETEHRNLYDVMSFEAASDDVHVYQSIRT